MEFGILGPLEVRREGGVVSLDAAKQRALLTILLLHANQTVPRDRLIDDLCGAAPPATAANAIQVYVAQLRKALEPGRRRDEPNSVLLTRSGGYELHVEPRKLDAERFELLLAEGSNARATGDPSAASSLLREALGLWRGSALADFTYEPFAQTEIARLDELRLSAIEERLDADLALGNHATVVGELEALVHDHPLRERLRAQLMLALYRARRQADALEVYRDARRALTEELGLEPSPELQRLEGAILRQDEELDLPKEPVPELPPPVEAAVPTVERRKVVTVLVTARPRAAGIDPEALRTRDERDLATARGVVESHGGIVEDVFGDQLMAVFGIPLVHEDDALRAAARQWSCPVARRASQLVRSLPASPSPRRDCLLASRSPARSSLPAQLARGRPCSRRRRARSSRRRREWSQPRSPTALRGAFWSWSRDHRPSRGRPTLRSWVVRASSPNSRPRSTVPSGGEPCTCSRSWAQRASARRGWRRSSHRRSAVPPPFWRGDASHMGRASPSGPCARSWARLTAEVPLSELVASEEVGNPELVAKRITEAIGQADASSTLEEIFSAFRALLQALAQERPGAFDHGLRPFRFRHLLIQQSTYRAIPKRMRAELHERVAAWLEAKLGEESVEYAEIGGYHLEQTYHYRGELGPVSRHRDLARRAAKLLATAGRRAFGRGDMPASANLLQRAASLLPADDCARLELLNDLGYALFEVGELERANAVLSESIDGGRRRGDPAIEWTATVKLAHARMYTNPEEQDTDALIQLAESGVRYDLAHLDVLDDQARAIPRQRPGRLRLRPRIRRKALEAAGLRTLSLMASAASSDFRARRSVAKA